MKAHNLPIVLLPIMLVGLLASCNTKDTPSQNTPLVERQGATVGADDAKRAAAEYFETLTEQAFSASPTELTNVVSKANSAIADLGPRLSANDRLTIFSSLQNMNEAHTKGNRADLAIASIEVYRSLVVSLSAEAKIPNVVSLLDYAGFRYDANLQANPVRWDDMQTSATMAKDYWAQLKGQVTDKALANHFAATLQNMQNAIGAKNLTEAKASVKRELDLVDLLEGHFAKSS